MKNLIPLMQREWLQHRFAWAMLILVPLALVLATALVVMILYGREFHSEVLQVLRD